MAREFFPIISAASRILFSSSQMAIQPHATALASGVTKSVVCALSKNLVKEFEGTGTTVITIVPDFVVTPWRNEKPEEINQNIYPKNSNPSFCFC